jgi:hypothetical protein
VNLAIAIVAFLFLASAACIVAGVQMLAGMAGALIASGLILFGAGAYLRAGLKPND